MPRVKEPASVYPEYGHSRWGENASGETEYDYFRASGSVLPGRLAETPFYATGEWLPQDVDSVRQFLVESAPLANAKLHPSFWEHALLASLYARKLAERVPSLGINPYQAEGLNLLHDLGRQFSPDQFYRNDLLTDAFANQAGFKTAELFNLPSESHILGLKLRSIESIDDLSPIQRVVHVGDWLGKRKADGSLVAAEEIINKSNASWQSYRDKAVWPSTHRGLDAAEAGRSELGDELFRDEIEWFESQGVDFAEVAESVQRALEEPDVQAWLYDVKNAQESLDPEADRQLNRPPIKRVVFDVGAVLFKDSQNALYQKMSERLGVTPEAIEAAIEKTMHTPEIMGGLTGEQDYLGAFYRELGVEGLPPEQMVAAFHNPEIYESIEGMQEIIEGLSTNPNIKLSILSDSISVVVDPLAQKLKELFPQFVDVHISGSIGASKQDPEGSAFNYLLGQLGTEDPREVLFVDDREVYTTAARAKFGMRALTFRGNPASGLSAVERLKQELEKVQLLPN